MRTAIVLASLVLVSISNVQADDCNKDWMAQKSACYKKQASDLLKTELSEWEKKCDDYRREAAAAVVATRKKLGTVMDKLADAYDEKDRKRINALEQEKGVVEKELEVDEAKRQVAHRLADIDHYAKEYPNSSEFKELRKEGETLSKEYVELTIQAQKLISQREAAQRKLDKLSKRGEIIKHELKLRELKKDM